MLHRSNTECVVMEICCCAWWRLGSDQSIVGLVEPVWVLLELAACGPLGRRRILMTLETDALPQPSGAERPFHGRCGGVVQLTADLCSM